MSTRKYVPERSSRENDAATSRTSSAISTYQRGGLGWRSRAISQAAAASAPVLCCITVPDDIDDETTVICKNGTHLIGGWKAGALRSLYGIWRACCTDTRDVT